MFYFIFVLLIFPSNSCARGLQGSVGILSSTWHGNSRRHTRSIPQWLTGTIQLFTYGI